MTLPGTPIAALLLLAAAVGLVTPLFGGARSAMLTDVLEGELWVRGRSMMRVLSQSSLLLGFAAGGLVLAAIGPRALLVADAVSFVLSALLLRAGTSARPARLTGRARVSFGAAGAALRDPQLRPLLLLTWLLPACISS